MEFIITFFRDILDGPLYIVVAVISIILICSCIGYLAETSINKKKAKQEYENSHANLSANFSNISGSNLNQVSTVINTTESVEPQPSINGSVPEIGANENAAFQQMSSLNTNTPDQNIDVPLTMGTPIPPPTVTNQPKNMAMPSNNDN